jgi:peptidoglycan hydrolase CwlO-like protein
MIDPSTLFSLIAVILSGIGLLLSWKKGNKVEDQKEATEITTVIVKLENISNDTKDIKNELRNVRNEVSDLRERVTIAEQAAKSLHRRVDTLENRFCNADK